MRGKNFGNVIGEKTRDVNRLLAEAMVEYCDVKKISQRDLSVELGLSSGAVNFAVRNPEAMSPDFFHRAVDILPGMGHLKAMWHRALGEDLGLGEAATTDESKDAERRLAVRKGLLEVQGLLTSLLHEL